MEGLKYNPPYKRSMHMSDVLNSINVCLNIFLVLISIYIIRKMYLDMKLEKIKPTRYSVRSFVDEDGNKVLPSKAMYAILLNNKKVKVRGNISDTEDSILVHSDGEHYMMYRERTIHTDDEDILAGLKITRTSIKYFIIPIMLFISSLCIGFINSDKDELERLRSIQDDRMNYCLEYMSEDDFKRLYLYMNIFLDATPDNIPDYQYNIFTIDSMLYLSDITDDITVVESNNKVTNFMLKESEEVVEDALDVMKLVEKGEITEEEAEDRISDILFTVRLISYTLLSFRVILRIYSIGVFIIWGIRYVFYLLFKVAFRKQFT